MFVKKGAKHFATAAPACQSVFSGDFCRSRRPADYRFGARTDDFVIATAGAVNQTSAKPLSTTKNATSGGYVRRIPALLFILIAATNATAQSRVEKNLIYGMYSGLALLMDVHHPDRPNGYGVIFVGGSGWQAPTSYGAVGLKEGQASQWVPPLLAAGYTVFAINHRAAPRFHYPAAVEDVQRAVRFIRHGAPKLGINPNRIGGVGGSSGAHLLALVAMLGAPGTAGDGDGVNREPATLQCVVLRAGPSDLRQMIGSSGLSTAAVVSFMERAPTPNADDQKAYRAASPIEHVSPTAPPALLLHGDADDTGSMKVIMTGSVSDPIDWQPHIRNNAAP